MAENKASNKREQTTSSNEAKPVNPGQFTEKGQREGSIVFPLETRPSSTSMFVTGQPHVPTFVPATAPSTAPPAPAVTPSTDASEG
jgi:hypothetical protein